MKKSKNGLAIFIVVFGAILVAAAAFVAIRSSVYRKNGIETVATITRIEHETDSDGDDNASVYVSYTVNGENYEGKLDYYSSFMRVGNTVKIFYMPDDPQDMISAGSNVAFVTIMIAFGIICIGLGTACVAVPAAQKRRLNRLKKNGRKVNARVKEFDCPGKTRVMGKNIARLVCVDPDGNRYETRFLYDTQRYFDIETPGAVYVDPDDPEKYAIDVD